MGKYSFRFDSEEVRDLLQRAHKIKEESKCLECEGTGWENWDEWGDDVRPGKSSRPDRDSGECESCKGVGYLI